MNKQSTSLDTKSLNNINDSPGALITGLKAQIKNPERVSVYIDKKFHCGLSVSQVVDMKLKVGLEVDQAFAKNLKRQSDLGKLHMSTIEWLFRRPRSRRELGDYFYKKQLDDDEKTYVLERVEKYLDDEAFARFWVEGRRSTKNKSARNITAELRQKGVSSEIIEQVLDNHDVQDPQALGAVIAKKQRQTKYQDPQKLTEYLLRQGFNYQDITEALAEE